MCSPVISKAFLTLGLRIDILAANRNDIRNFGGYDRAGCNAELQRAQRQVIFQIFNDNTRNLQQILSRNGSRFSSSTNPSTNVEQKVTLSARLITFLPEDTRLFNSIVAQVLSATHPMQQLIDTFAPQFLRAQALPPGSSISVLQASDSWNNSHVGFSPHSAGLRVTFVPSPCMDAAPLSMLPIQRCDLFQRVTVAIEISFYKIAHVTSYVNQLVNKRSPCRSMYDQVQFGAGVSGAIGRATGCSKAIDCEAKNVIKKFNVMHVATAEGALTHVPVVKYDDNSTVMLSFFSISVTSFSPGMAQTSASLVASNPASVLFIPASLHTPIRFEYDVWLCS